MGWFTGYYEKRKAEVPYKIKVHIAFAPGYKPVEEEFTTDLVYIPGKFQALIIDMDQTARYKAINRAYGIKEYGIRVGDTVYPAHRIQSVQIIKCKWDIKLVEDTDASQEYQES
jgi:hypothetical protein